MNNYMNLALKEAKKAYLKGDVPVGAVIVKHNKVISKAHNTKQSKNQAINHAEIIAIKKACRKLKTWHLDDCEIYITLEPCLMCCGAIIQSRIKKIYYSIESPKFGYIESVESVFSNKNNHTPFINKGIAYDESKEMLVNFFKNKREQ